MFEFIHPNLLALIAAVLAAASLGFYRAALAGLSPEVTTIVVNLIVAAFGCGVYLLGRGVAHWPLAGVLWFVASGLFGSFLGRYLNMVSFTFIGMARSQVLAQTMPLWSALIAIIFLGERLTAGVAAGTLAVMGGAMLLVQGERDRPGRVPWVAYTIPIASAFVLGMTPTMRKFAFPYIPSASFGLACASFSGAALQMASLPFVPRRGGGAGWSARTAGALLAGALVNGFAGVLYWTAVKTGELVQVVPLRRLSVLFVLLFSWLFFRRQERLTMPVVAGALLSLAGGVVIALGR